MRLNFSDNGLEISCIQYTPQYVDKITAPFHSESVLDTSCPRGKQLANLSLVIYRPY